MARIIPLFDFVSKISLDISQNVEKLDDLNKFDVLFPMFVASLQPKEVGRKFNYSFNRVIRRNRGRGERERERGEPCAFVKVLRVYT